MSAGSDKGKAGEQYVCEYLMNSGWNIAARNYRIRGGEIDIAAEKGDVLAFVEVKTRRAGTLSDGAEAVTHGKQSRIIKTAGRYLAEHPTDAGTIRFDTAFVTVAAEDEPRVLGMEYIENAFDAFFIPEDMNNFNSME